MSTQLELWQKGFPTHGESCCPDFSCCQPQLLAPQEVRDLYVAAVSTNNEAVKQRLLMTFLGKAFADKKVYIAGLETSRREIEEQP